MMGSFIRAGGNGVGKRKAAIGNVLSAIDSA